MNFLPRRRGQSFGGFGRQRIMGRPSRRGFIGVRKPIHTSYIDVSTGIALAASVDANYSLLLASDSPNTSLVTDMASVVSQVENNSRIIKKGSFIQLNFLASDAPGTVGIWVYMNSKGTVVAPADIDDFNQGPNTLANSQLREYTIFYKQMSLDINSFRSLRIPLGSRRNNYLSDGSILVIVIDNMSATTAIQFSGYGRIRTIQG